MEPTIHKDNPFGPCPCCGSELATIDIEKSIAGYDKNGIPASFFYLVTLRCARCSETFFMEGRSMVAIYKQWEDLRKECAKL